MKINRLNGVNGASFSEEELYKALMFIEDIMERVVVHYVVMRDTAYSIYHGNELKGREITVGILKKNITKEVLWTFESLLKDIRMTDRGFIYLFGKIPIVVKFINKHYKFFDCPNFKYYRTGQYDVANPFDKYWNMRYFVV